MSTQCKSTVYDEWSVRDRRCGNNASSDGFCGVHHPDKVKARQERQALRNEEYRKRSCNYKLGEARKKIEGLEAVILNYEEEAAIDANLIAELKGKRSGWDVCDEHGSMFRPGLGCPECFAEKLRQQENG